jgi:spore coat protein A, manganese oxidase
VDNSIDYDHTDKVMAFQVGQTVTDPTNNSLPVQLAPVSEPMGLRPDQARKTRHLRFERQGSEWVIDGHTWEEVVESEYRRAIAEPGLGDIEIWELENSSGGWFHPVHVHLVDFQVLDRNGRPPEPFEKGPKDVVYVGEGETVRILMQFTRRTGRYMIHCHNTSHEDHDMMAQFWVGGQGAGPDPITAAPPQPVPTGPLPPPVAPAQQT